MNWSWSSAGALGGKSVRELPPPIEPLECRHPDCTLASKGRCARLAEFGAPLEECPELLRETLDAERSSPIITATESMGTAWSGQRLAMEWCDRLTGYGPARLVGVLGHYDAGKTSWLSSMFLQLANGHLQDRYRFASSQTLKAWNELLEHVGEWDGTKDSQIVPHTPTDYSPEVELFLHLGLSSTAAPQRHVDIILSDVPGEWVQTWGRNAKPSHANRLSFLERCDALVLVLDATKLFEDDGRRFVSELRTILKRMVMTGDKRRCRAVALVLSKFDKVLERIPSPAAPGDTLEAWMSEVPKLRPLLKLMSRAQDVGVDTAVFPTSAFPDELTSGQPVGVVEPMEFLLERLARRTYLTRKRPAPREGAHPFAYMGSKWLP